MGWQIAFTFLAAGLAIASLLWSYTLNIKLTERDVPEPSRDPAPQLDRLEALIAELKQSGADRAPMRASSAIDEIANAVDIRHSTLFAVIVEQVFTRDDYKGSEPFVLVVDVMLVNNSDHDVRISWRNQDNRTPLAIRRYLGGDDKRYSAPQLLPMTAALDAERAPTSQVVRAHAIETLDFAVPLHDPGLYRMTVRIRGDEVVGEESKAPGSRGAVIWSRNKHVVVG